MFLKLLPFVIALQGVLGSTEADPTCNRLQESFKSCIARGYTQKGGRNNHSSHLQLACSTLEDEMDKHKCSKNIELQLSKRSQGQDPGFCSGNLCFRMDTGVVLPINHSIISLNGKFVLKIQGDKNLVEYCYTGVPIWHTNTARLNHGGLVFTKEGRLEVRENGSGRVLWTNGVSGGHMLIVQNDGNIVMYNVQERNIWNTGTSGTYCERGSCGGDRCLKPSRTGKNSYAVLKLGESLISENGKYDLRMQPDGNLVEYCNGITPIWHSNTNGKSVDGGLRLQGDSNLVIYDPNPIWSSGSDNSGGVTLVMQNDGNIVLYSRNGTPVWHTATYNKC